MGENVSGIGEMKKDFEMWRKKSKLMISVIVLVKEKGEPSEINRVEALKDRWVSEIEKFEI